MTDLTTLRANFEAETADFNKKIDATTSKFTRLVHAMTLGRDAVQRQDAVLKKNTQTFSKATVEVKKLERAYEKAAKVNPVSPDATNKLGMLTTGYNEQTKSIQKLSKNVDKAKLSFKSFSGELLSMLFFGMMIQVAFTGALKSMFEGYKKIIPESHEFNRMTTQLSANWEFFKFQMADALAQSPLFQTLIRFMIFLVQQFQKLSPGMKVFLGFAMMGLAIFGGLLFLIGSVGLGMIGLSSFIANVVLAFGVLSKAVGFIKPLFTAFTTIASVGLGVILAVIGIVIAGFLIAREIIQRFLVTTGGKLDGFWNSALAIASTFFAGIANMVIGLIGAFLSGGVAIIGVVIGLAKTIWDVFSNLFDSIADGLVAALTGGSFTDAFMDSIENPITSLMNNINDFVIEPSKAIVDTAGKLIVGVTELNSEFVNSLATKPNEEDSTGATTVNNTTIMSLEQARAQGVIDEEVFQTANTAFNEGGI